MAKPQTRNHKPKKQRGNRNLDEVQEKAEEVSKKAELRAERRRWAQDDSMQQGLLVIILFALAAVSFLSFIHAAGDFGEFVDRFFGWLFGWGRFITPIIFAVLGYIFLHPDTYQIKILNYIGLVLFVLSGLGLLHLFVPVNDLLDAAAQGKGGGYFGILFAYPLLRFTGVWVTIVVLIALFICSWIVMFNTSLRGLFGQMKFFRLLRRPFTWVRSRLHARVHGYRVSGEDAVDDTVDGETDTYQEDEQLEEDAAEAFSSKEVEALTEAARTATDLEQMELIPLNPEVETAPKPRKRFKKIDLPLSLLTDRNEKPTSGDIEFNKKKIQETLGSFGIEVEMGEVNVGPMVTQYTLTPAQGVKITQITTLHNDIALALAAHPVRIEAPIPGKPYVGIEVPNKMAATVTLKEVLASKQFKQRKDNLALCLGKDVSGKPYLASITTMPHMLIAGATGSGKSVCINGIIISLLYQNSPDNLRFIMVDPKRVELTMYNDIPHLLTPVITDVEKTINALKWTVAEMDRRYELLARAGKRNIESYNTAVEEDDKLAYIVFIIDELADLMAVAANSVEAAIVRLAQMSRAVGIHLVLATQRPSVNVITGLIKANMPARIAFSVTSLVDSRTILDFSGAEKLLGRGDMLYIDAKLSKPKRLQGAFLDDGEIERVVEYLRNQGDPQYNTEVIDKTVKSNIPGFSDGGDNGENSDDLLDDAKDIILQSGKASASLLQRRLRVGYARAARILDILEEQGFIGPADGAKPREILVNQDDFSANATGTILDEEDADASEEHGEVRTRPLVGAAEEDGLNNGGVDAKEDATETEEDEQ
ncbi:MAG: DNA translocase FtsK 4TM domain-containing protein [Candidatus Kerfeldbacteria bacterium]|nr:DNA translocase FtsK 4TM domain-containing protein [Candidatus Kerfeldbacteria bacterium]